MLLPICLLSTSTSGIVTGFYKRGQPSLREPSTEGKQRPRSSPCSVALMLHSGSRFSLLLKFPSSDLQQRTHLSRQASRGAQVTPDLHLLSAWTFVSLGGSGASPLEEMAVHSLLLYHKQSPDIFISLINKDFRQLKGLQGTTEINPQEHASCLQRSGFVIK